MEVPTPIEELHVTHALLDQPAREKAIVGEAGGAGLRAVRFEHQRRLAGDVHHLGHRHLHAEGQLILGDAGEGFGMTQLLGLHLVQVAQGVETLAAQVAVHARRIGDIEHGIAFRAALHSLIDRR